MFLFIPNLLLALGPLLLLRHTKCRRLTTPHVPSDHADPYSGRLVSELVLFQYRAKCRVTGFVPLVYRLPPDGDHGVSRIQANLAGNISGGNSSAQKVTEETLRLFEPRRPGVGPRGVLK